MRAKPWNSASAEQSWNSFLIPENGLPVLIPGNLVWEHERSLDQFAIMNKVNCSADMYVCIYELDCSIGLVLNRKLLPYRCRSSIFFRPLCVRNWRLSESSWAHSCPLSRSDVWRDEWPVFDGYFFNSVFLTFSILSFWRFQFYLFYVSLCVFWFVLLCLRFWFTSCFRSSQTNQWAITDLTSRNWQLTNCI